MYEAAIRDDDFQGEDLISHQAILGRHVGETATLHKASVSPNGWRTWG
jgi:hypothetical protein